MSTSSRRRVLAGLTLYCAIALVGACRGRAATLEPCERGEKGWVAGGAECLHVETFRSRVLSDQPRLVVAIHGDAPFHNPGYQYLWAQKVAEANDDVVAVGLLRPGYTDPAGRESSGRRGLTTGDNYTPEVVDAIAGVIRSLAETHGARRILIAGHSGGAAITANVMGRHPGLAASALLVSCPCNVARFREHMRDLQGGLKSLVWRLPVRSLSPHELARTVDARATIAVIVGERDNIALPVLSRDYRDRLKGRGVRVEYTELQGRDHEIFLDDEVQAAATWLLGETPAAEPTSARGAHP